MICYRDMSFCIAYEAGDCANHSCRRAFTALEAERARKWWKGCEGEAPVAMSDLSKGCPAIIRPGEHQ